MKRIILAVLFGAMFVQTASAETPPNVVDQQQIDSRSVDSKEQALKVLAEKQQALIEAQAKEIQLLRVANESLKIELRHSYIRLTVWKDQCKKEADARVENAKASQETIGQEVREIDAMLAETTTVQLGRRQMTIYAVQGKARETLVTNKKRTMFLRGLLQAFTIGFEAIPQQQAGIYLPY